MACDEAVTSSLLEPHIYARSIMQDRKIACRHVEPWIYLGHF